MAASTDPNQARSFRVAADIGGTFTDCVAVGSDGSLTHAKTLSTHATSPDEGVLTGVDLLAQSLGVERESLLDSTDRFSHGTTIGTNLVVERKGAKVALIATAGNGDALLMMRGNGRTAGLPLDQVYSVHRPTKPEPLVPRSRILEIDERVDVSGEVVTPLDWDRTAAQIRELLASEEIEAVAVALLWSVRNDVHELAVRDMIREIDASIPVSLSHEVAPRPGEYERMVATVINAYVGPASSRYLDRLADRLRERGLADPPLVMQASGGVMPVAAAKERASAMIGSGPAGGLIGAANLAAAAGHENVIATDMGGTSFDVGLVIDGDPVIASKAVIDRYTYLMPQLDILSIACGGGSIARVDEHARAIRVGPDSAGSYPGPACYGNGGTEPTVTDADVVLGIINPDRFLAGRMELDVEAARAAVRSVAEPLGLSVEEAAAGIIRVNNYAAATLIRQRTIQAGLDPRDFVLYAFGGAGPVHAYGFAAELGVDRVIAPLGNGASTLSAFGIAGSAITRYFEQECKLRTPIDAAEVNRMVTALEDEARASLGGGEVRLERFALMHYAEQYQNELPLPLPAGEIDAAAIDQLEADFTKEYSRLHGEGALAAFQMVELFGIRVRASIPAPTPSLSVGESGREGPIEPLEVRDVFWPATMRPESTAVYSGADLGRSDEIAGPAIVELSHTTVAVAPGQRLNVDTVGNLILHIQPKEAA